MLNAEQSELFNKGYGAYRDILKLLVDNADKLHQEDDDSTIPALIMMADMEIQKILLDISSCEQYALTEDEQSYIKSLVESSEALKALIPGYGKFYRNMTPANYCAVKERFDELSSQDVPLALGFAVELQKNGLDCVEQIIENYRIIFDTFSAMSDFREEEQNDKVSSWLSKFKAYATEQGVDIVKETQEPVKTKKILAEKKIEKKENTSERTAQTLPDMSELEESMYSKWVGTLADIRNLCNAFMRRYAGGKKGMHPKTHIVILGTESRGKVFAAKCMSRALKEYDIVSTSAVPIIDFAEYPTGTDFIIFLSDLYRALYQISDIVVFANFEMADQKQLDSIYQLMSKGILHLDRRYVDRNGMLVDATGILTTETISEISANGKSFVLTSTLSQGNTTEFLGGKILSEITDIIVLDPLCETEISRLVDIICASFVSQCRRELSLNVSVTDDFKEKIRSIYDVKLGAQGMLQYIRLNVFNPLTDLCLSGRFSEGDDVEITCESDEFWAVDSDSRGVSLSNYVKAYNQVELDKVKEELDGVIGLEAVKKYIYDLENNVKIRKLRESRGLKNGSLSMHMIFTGNPGTGKTTIARIVAKYLKSIGVLSTGQLVEVTRADLVAKYVGQTAPKTTAAIKSAVGGVLFIDEAYSLYRGKNDEYGIEAIDTLVKGIEDYRDDLVVILAGYTKEMDEFMKANPGLKSRFPNIIHFDDYSTDDMWKIAEVTARGKGYRISESCYESMRDEFDRHQIKGRNDGGNGRLVRNMIESAILRQSQRIATDPSQDLELLIPEDFGFTEKKPFDLEARLEEIVGLEEVKDFIRSQYKLQKANAMRKKMGLKVDTSQTLNMIFAGNPGTGKTTMARLVAEMFHELGILKSGHLVETDKGGLIAQYVGHTAEKTEEVFRSALGGVLFIDEAYAITNDHSSFGQECIDTLVKLIEDYRGETLVILAGYSKEMKEFMKSNSGLESRFPLFIEFPDYSATELYQIGKKMISSKGFELSEDGDKAFEEEIADQKRIASENAGNGRLARNIVESIIRAQSVRIVDENVIAEDMNLIVPSDIRSEDAKLAKFDLEEELSKIIGLDEVKNFVRTQYRMCLAKEKRRQAGVAVDATQSLNMVFTGNPGTGKTTVARVIAEMFKSMGLLKKGHIVETDKGGLVAQFVGQTAQKTGEVFKSAIGGVLFIDEAYGITNDGSQFGQECIDTLVKLIEDHRGEIVVILAGYTKEMNEFMKANSGLESRFPLRMEFQDYSANELFEIGKLQIRGNGFELSEEAETVFKEEVFKLKRRSGINSGNGRMVRNFVEEIIREQSARIAINDVSVDEINIIIPQDVRDDSVRGVDFDLEAEFKDVIGLDSVKNYVRGLSARLRVQEERRLAGLKTDDAQTLHMIFAGNPGTGKTMMARTVANVLFSIGVINTNKLVETDRSDLVAGYVGQTAIKTRQVIERALDGVLFVDEAYSLAQGGENDFGKEAIDTLVKMMDDNRERLVVILAGYSENMKHFLSMNPGLKSRFANIIEFPDYSTEDLMLITDKFYDAHGYKLSDAAREELKSIFDQAKRNSTFGNGRYVRNVYEKTLNCQAMRLSNTTSGERDLMLITGEDVRAVIPELNALAKSKGPMGFMSNI